MQLRSGARSEDSGGARSILFWAGAGWLGLALLGLLGGGAQAQVVTEFSVGISANAGLNGITAGPDGNLWFTEYTLDRIGKITPAGVVTEYGAGITAGARPYGIAAGPDGNLWFTESAGNRIGKITPAGAVTEYGSGISAGAGPLNITAGPDGNLWFTESHANRIGKITPAGVVTEVTLRAGARANGIAAGPDGNLWFTEFNEDRIGKITPAGVVTEYSSGITAGGYSVYIAAGPDGNLWFTQADGHRIGKITPAGVVTEYGIGAGADPNGITAGPDGNLWFTEFIGNRIGRITAPPALAALENPQPGSFQSGIGVLSGWSCQGPSIAVAIDGQPPLPVPHGSPRADTAGVCGAGSVNSGFGLLLNFNTLGSGQHSAQLYVNGAARGNAVPFTVVAPAGEFLTGQSKQVTVPDFPAAGKSTVLIWQESQQNFAIKSASP